MPLKTLLIGTTEVGKTSLLMRNEEEVKLQIWDTAGQERYRAITTAYYRGAKGFVLVFSLTNKKSFTSLDEWIKLARENTSDDIHIVSAGNKSDQADQRVVSTEEAKEYADSVGCEYFETSSKDGTNITEVFEALLRKVIKEPEEAEKKPEKTPEVPEEKPKEPESKPEKPEKPESKTGKPENKPEKPEQQMKKPNTKPEQPMKETEKEKEDKKPGKGEAEAKPGKPEKVEGSDGGNTIQLGGGCKHAHHHHHHEHSSCMC